MFWSVCIEYVLNNTFCIINKNHKLKINKLLSLMVKEINVNQYSACFRADSNTLGLHYCTCMGFRN